MIGSRTRLGCAVISSSRHSPVFFSCQRLVLCPPLARSVVSSRDSVTGRNCISTSPHLSITRPLDHLSPSLLISLSLSTKNGGIQPRAASDRHSPFIVRPALLTATHRDLWKGARPNDPSTVGHKQNRAESMDLAQSVNRVP
jgi:hypothetical protein